MNRTASLGLAVALLALASACDDKKDTPAMTTDAAATMATGTAATAAASGSAGSPLTASADATEEDFEEEAEKSITASNLEAEIAKMEAELK